MDITIELRESASVWDWEADDTECAELDEMQRGSDSSRYRHIPSFNLRA